MLIAIAVAALLAGLFSYLVHKWILRPINRLIESTNEIRRGNLDLVLQAGSGDEIGRLSESFNDMTSALRQVRKKEQMDLIRTQRATEEVFKNLPAAIAVLDLGGRVEISTDTAKQHFGLRPGVLISELRFEWLAPLIQRALEEGGVIEMEPEGGFVQQFIGNSEYFFQPMVARFPVGPEYQEPTGVVLILKDVTQAMEHRELKRDVISTVSHQLRTPLTSLRMSVHLLLDEKLGTLNEKQTELMIAARDDSERLAVILDDLLNINRLESGKANLSPEPVSPAELVHQALEPFLMVAKDKGIAIVEDVPDNLPRVMVDLERIRYVFANLLSNALRFTRPGGTVTVGAVLEDVELRFTITDTGAGIAVEHQTRLFEPFFRVPGQDEKSGAGLGLSVVKKIVEAHGGTVAVESVPDQGATFSFTMPIFGFPTH